MNDAVSKWKLHGHLYIWRYMSNVRNYPGWHLTTNAQGGESLLELLDLMAGSNYSSEAQMLLSPADAEQLRPPNAGSASISATTLTVRYSPMKMGFEHWSLQESESTLRIEIGRGNLSRLREGIVDVLTQRGDYCIGSDGEELWFWPEQFATSMRGPHRPSL